MPDNTMNGSCFCGEVQISVTGSPEAMGYCHCESCRSWAAAPVNGFTLWNPEKVKVTKGAESIGTFHKTDRSHRQFCRIGEADPNMIQDCPGTRLEIHR